MSTEPTATCERVIVDITPDKMTATICLQNGDDADRPPWPDEILAALDKAQVAVSDAVKKRVAELLRLIEADESIPEPFVVAQGEPPFNGEDEQFVWDDAFQKEAADWQGDCPVDYYDLNSITTVEQDAVIGTISPLVPPRDGVNVKGLVIKPKGSPQCLELDQTIRRSPDDPLKIIAAIAGRVVQSGKKLHIDEVLYIPGDIDFETGNVDSTVDVHIKGAIPDRFEVKSVESITVGAAIEAATVAAEGNVVVRGGIVGRNAGRVTAGGEIVAKFCNEADLVADGDVKITSQLMNCRVRTHSRLIAESAAVIGGHLYVRYGGGVATLGSEGFVPTRIFMGVPPEALKEAAEIEESLKPKREAVERLRATVQPLMADLKRLAPTQREQATELIFKADEAAAQIAEEEERRDQLLTLKESEDQPRFRVSRMIHPRVVVSLGSRLVTFDEELKGPVSLEERKMENVTEFVAVNTLTASVTVLPSQHMPINELVSDFEPLAAG